MSHFSCCVVNCTNTGRNSKCKFYRFPTASWKLEQRNKWIAAVKRKNIDGSPWFPKPHDTICSDHFISGKKSEEQLSPSYVPTIFPLIYRTKKDNELTVLKGFPSDPIMKDKWLKALKMENFVPKKFSSLCSKHFEAKCFREKMRRCLLRRDAVPSIPEKIHVDTLKTILSAKLASTSNFEIENELDVPTPETSVANISSPEKIFLQQNKSGSSPERLIFENENSVRKSDSSNSSSTETASEAEYEMKRLSDRFSKVISKERKNSRQSLTSEVPSMEDVDATSFTDEDVKENFGNVALLNLENKQLRCRYLCEDHFLTEAFINETKHRLTKFAIPVPYTGSSPLRQVINCLPSASTDLPVLLQQEPTPTLQEPSLKRKLKYSDYNDDTPRKKRLRLEIESNKKTIRNESSISLTEEFDIKAENSETNDEDIYDISGRRIVDIQYFFNGLKSIKHINLNCSFSDVNIKSEKRVGLISIFTFKCMVCNSESVVHSENPETVTNLNKAVADLGSTDGEYNPFEEMCAVLDVPFTRDTTYRRNNDAVSSTAKELAFTETETAGEEECQMTVAEEINNPVSIKCENEPEVNISDAEMCVPSSSVPNTESKITFDKIWSGTFMLPNEFWSHFKIMKNGSCYTAFTRFNILHETTPVVEKQIVVKSDMTIKYIVMEEMYSNSYNIFPKIVTSIQEFENVLVKFNDLNICKGGLSLNNSQLILQPAESSVKYPDKKFNVWRHRKCTILLTGDDTDTQDCRFCKSLYKIKI